MSRKEDLKAKLTKLATEQGIDLPNHWYNRGEENLQVLYDTLSSDGPDEEIVGDAPVSVGNPFGEKVIEVHMPIDKQNPKIKVVWFSVNFKPLWFPLGKTAYMPESYHRVYLNAMASEQKAMQKTYEYFFKEV